MGVGGRVYRQFGLRDQDLGFRFQGFGFRILDLRTSFRDQPWSKGVEAEDPLIMSFSR